MTNNERIKKILELLEQQQFAIQASIVLAKRIEEEFEGGIK